MLFNKLVNDVKTWAPENRKKRSATAILNLWPEATGFQFTVLSRNNESAKK
jgi:hypothetical protein